jgi:hypothetical protein
MLNAHTQNGDPILRRLSTDNSDKRDPESKKSFGKSISVWFLAKSVPSQRIYEWKSFSLLAGEGK